jgi:hypothetical protein
MVSPNRSRVFNTWHGEPELAGLSGTVAGRCLSGSM